MRQFSAGNQWLSAGRKMAFSGQYGQKRPGEKPGHNGASSGLLEVQPAHEVALAQRNAVDAQDVVGGGGVEIEIG